MTTTTNDELYRELQPIMGEYWDNLVALINTYNESRSPSVPRTDEEHKIEADRARTALWSIRRNYREGVDYKELSNGALWPISSAQKGDR